MEKKEKDLNQEIDMEKETEENLEESEAKTSEQETSTESENLEQTDQTEIKKTEEDTEENTSKEQTPQRRKIGRNQLIIMIAVGILVIASLFLLTRDKLVLKPYKVNIGEDVYITLDQLVNESKTNIDLDTLKIKHPFGDKDKYKMNSDGRVKTKGLDYLDAGTYEVEVYSTEKDNLSETVKIEVIDDEDPEFINFDDEVEMNINKDVSWEDYYEVEDKSIVDIQVYENDSVFTPETKGTYDVTVTATDTAGNSSSKNGKITVKEKNYGDIAGYEVAIRQHFADAVATDYNLKMEYDKETETYDIYIAIDGTAESYVASEEMRETLKNDFIDIAKSMRTIALGYGIPIKHFNVYLVNDVNTENALLLVHNGVLAYEASID